MKLVTDWLMLIKNNWYEEFRSKNFIYHLIFTTLFFIFAIVSSVHFINKCEYIDGTILHDIILDFLPSYDVSIFIFVLTYSTIAITIASMISNPKVFIKGFQMYGMLVLTRALFIMLFPLNPPEKMMLLNDSIGNFLLNQPQTPITKDLFFSGHTSTMVLMLLLSTHKKWNYVVSAVCIIVPILLLIQHVHYTVDIVAAPFFSYAIYTFVNRAHRYFKTDF